MDTSATLYDAALRQWKNPRSVRLSTRQGLGPTQPFPPPSAEPDPGNGGQPQQLPIGSQAALLGLHECVVEDAEAFDANTFREMDGEVDGKPVVVVIAKRIGETFTGVQAIRYAGDIWTEADARSHCKAHRGVLFTPAAGGA